MYGVHPSGTTAQGIGHATWYAGGVSSCSSPSPDATVSTMASSTILDASDWRSSTQPSSQQLASTSAHPSTPARPTTCTYTVPRLPRHHKAQGPWVLWYCTDTPIAPATRSGVASRRALGARASWVCECRCRRKRNSAPGMARYTSRGRPLTRTSNVGPSSSGCRVQISARMASPPAPIPWTPGATTSGTSPRSGSTTGGPPVSGKSSIAPPRALKTAT
mmetsp:Transcript_123845/g.284031  ORF Transcript_123845/g.284031 Transcript_123845/m.284031 type:complete len:219 (-) Transcript_123845:214-870(-)